MIDLILLQPIPEHLLSSFSVHLFRRSTIHLKVEVSSGLPFCDTQSSLCLIMVSNIVNYKSMASGLSCPQYSLLWSVTGLSTQGADSNWTRQRGRSRRKVKITSL